MRNSIRSALLLVATASAVAACGGGSYHAPMDEPPAMSGLSDQAIDQDTSTSSLAFTVGDRETVADSLVITTQSSDNNLIAPEGLKLAGSGKARTLTITPTEAAFGDASITVSVQDAAGQSVSRSFQVTVKPVFHSFTQFTTDTFAVAADAAVCSMKGFTLDSDADDNPGAFDALL